MSQDEGGVENNDVNRRLALLGLAMSTPNSPRGDRPDLAELWDFMHNVVNDVRRDEILSHLAEDEELFSEWQELQATTLEIEQAQVVDAYLPVREKINPPSRAFWQQLQEWIFYRPWISAGGVAAAVALLFFGTVSQRPPTSEDFWQAWSQPISSQSLLQDSVLRDDLDAVLTGVRTQLIELSYPGTGPSQQDLPEQVHACQADDASCTERRSALFTLGGLAIDQLRQCQENAEALTQLLPELQRIAGIVQSHPPLAVLATPINRWVEAAEQDTAAACDAAALVISGALPIE
ncbi:MAG: hypothetical protein AB8B64_18765 [Granulosicoccus sp.]